MLSIDQIKKNASDIVREEPMRSVCLRLIDVAAERKAKTNQGLWTYQVLSKWTGMKPDDPILQNCVQLLATSSKTKLFQIHFVLFDRNDPEDIGTKVADEEAAEALRTGVLFHPDTGEKISDFEDELVPYFSLATEASEE